MFFGFSNFAVIIALIGLPRIVINMIDRKPIVITGCIRHQTVNVDYSWFRMSDPSYDIRTIRYALQDFSGTRPTVSVELKSYSFTCFWLKKPKLVPYSKFLALLTFVCTRAISSVTCLGDTHNKTVSLGKTSKQVVNPRHISFNSWG